MTVLQNNRQLLRGSPLDRKDNAGPFKEVFRYFVAMLKDWKLIDGKTIAIDSFKIRAQNSLKNNFNERKVKRHLAYIDGRIAEYEGILTESDDEVVLCQP